MAFHPKVVPPGSPAVGYWRNFGGWVRAAVPQGGGSTVISSRVDYQAQAADGGTWHDCSLSGRCENLDRNIGFDHVEFLVFPTKGLQEPEVVVAGIAHTHGPRLRMRMYYSWNLPYCQSLVWDRLEPNGNDTLSAMVPSSAVMLDYGVRARDGNNEAQWAICNKQPQYHCKSGPGELDLDSLTEVQDLDGHMKGFVVKIHNGNSQHVRNVELFINYEVPKR